MTAAEDRIEIEVSKTKTSLMLLGALSFVTIGLWFVIAPPAIENAYWGNPTKIKILGYASILLFGFCAVIFMRKLPGNKPALIIDQTTLMDNSGWLSAGQILWTDIEEISVFQFRRQKLIMLHVSNPGDYIDRQTSLFKRKTMELNNRMYGTPLSISTNGLKISFDQLLTILTSKLQQARRKEQQATA
jgi:hypothetical protein